MNLTESPLWRVFHRMTSKTWFAIGCLVLGCVISSWGSLQLIQLSATPEPVIIAASQENKTLLVDVSGAVVNPGVYRVSDTARLGEVVEQAGGFSQSADSDYIAQQINLAQSITEGQKIYIPFFGENITVEADSIPSTVNQGLVSINSASLDALDQLPGVGAKRAADIVAGRPYISLTDLVRKDILSESIFTQIKGLVTL